jgi:hypothetical protein
MFGIQIIKMLAGTEKQAVDQEVTALFDGYCIGPSTEEGFEIDNTSHEEATAQTITSEPQQNSATKEASASRDRYAHLDPDLASHAAEFECYRFLCKHSPWNQAEALPNLTRYSLQVTSGMPPPAIITRHPEPPTKRGRNETTDHSQKRCKIVK